MSDDLLRRASEPFQGGSKASEVLRSVSKADLDVSSRPLLAANGVTPRDPTPHTDGSG
jgi:hypothetical protein